MRTLGSELDESRKHNRFPRKNLHQYIAVESSDLQMNIRSAIIDQFTQVAQGQGIPMAPLTDDLYLLDSGLDSLCFAILVARLEGSLGVDPFTTSEDSTFPVTFGEFVRLYENAAD